MLNYQIPSYLKEKCEKIVGISFLQQSKSTLAEGTKLLTATFDLSLPKLFQKIFQKSRIAVRYSTISALVIIFLFGPVVLLVSRPNSAEAAGLIDDVKVFNYALTAAQVKNEYNGGSVNFAPLTGSP